MWDDALANLIAVETTKKCFSKYVWRYLTIQKLAHLIVKLQLNICEKMKYYT